MPKVQLAVGQACPTCNTPAIQGTGAVGEGYCKTCYIQWKNSQGTQPAPAPAPAPAPQPTAVTEFSKTLDQNKEQQKWDKIAEGKCRYGFALKAYEMGKELNVGTVTEINSWVNYITSGKIAQGINDINVDTIQLDE